MLPLWWQLCAWVKWRDAVVLCVAGGISSSPVKAASTSFPLMIRCAPLPWKAVSIYHQPSVPPRPYHVSNNAAFKAHSARKKRFAKERWPQSVSEGWNAFWPFRFVFAPLGKQNFAASRLFWCVCEDFFFQKCMELASALISLRFGIHLPAGHDEYKLHLIFRHCVCCLLFKRGRVRERAIYFFCCKWRPELWM